VVVFRVVMKASHHPAVLADFFLKEWWWFFKTKWNSATTQLYLASFSSHFETSICPFRGDFRRPNPAEIRGSGGYRLFHSSLPLPPTEEKIGQNQGVVAIPHYISKNHHRLAGKLSDHLKSLSKGD